MKNENGLNTRTTFSLSNKTYTIDEILQPIEFIPKGKKGYYISNVPSCFDIETTSFYNENNEKRATMYAWVFGINGKCTVGRTWSEFFTLIEKISAYYNLSLRRKFIVYIHNLSYEFQFFCKYFHWEKVFSTDNRKPLYATTINGIEFRCSYMLSGYNLETLGKNLLKYKVRKKVGDLDYNLIRHSQTPLNPQEWGYIIHDCLVVMAYIKEEIERIGSLKNIPLTKTGYVRQLCSDNCLKGPNRFSYVKKIKKLTLTTNDYKQAKKTYMGGFTHANIAYVGKTLNNVHSLDFTSSYPTVMISEKYPMSEPQKYQLKSWEDFYDKLKCYCCMFIAEFENIYSKVEFENYISHSKCIECENYILNNGRVIEADKLTIALTEQDFNIIEKMYKWDNLKIHNFKIMYKDYLPKDFIITILQLYKDKTTLKGVVGKEVEYLISKGMINSCYGMCVTDICKDDIEFNGEWKTTPANIDDLIDKYNNNKQRFLYYLWGIWVTAYSRRNLFTGILEFGMDYVYSDTDSVKVLNIEKHTDYITKYNNWITRRLFKCLDTYDISHEYVTPKTIKGEIKPLGVWDYEGKYDKFKTLGAKRYITESNGEIQLTVAGVNKKAGVKYLKYKFKTPENIFNNFEENLYFPPHYDKDGIDENGSGKLVHTYIDYEISGELIDYMGNVCKYHELSSIHMENTDYTMSLDNEFFRLLQGYKGVHII